MSDTTTIGMAALRERCKALGITPARSASETQQRIQAEEARRNLCQDEGCPQHGTAHVCIDKSAALTRLDAMDFDLEAPCDDAFMRDLAVAVFGETLTVAHHEPKIIPARMTYRHLEQPFVIIDEASNFPKPMRAFEPSHALRVKQPQNDPAVLAQQRRLKRKAMRRATIRDQRRNG